MAMNPIFRSSPTRMMGLSSGMDTDFIIQQTLRMHQFRIDQQMRQRTLIQWRQETHNSIRDQLRSFSNTFLSLTSPRAMTSSSSYNTHKFALTRPGGGSTSAVTIHTNASSTVGNFQVKSVNSLAKGASLTSSDRISADRSGFSLNTALGDLKLAGNPQGFGFADDWFDVSFGEGASASTVKIDRTVNAAGEFEYTLDGAPNPLEFKAHSNLTGGIAEITVGGETFNVTRLSNGALAKVNINEGVSEIAFSDNGFTLPAIGQGDDAKTVSVIRANDGTNNSYTYIIKDKNGDVLGEGNIDDFSGPGGIHTIDLGDGLSVKFKLQDGNLARVTDIAANAEAVNLDKKTFTINDGVNTGTITIDRTMTVSDMLREVNAHKDLNVTMSYDQITDRFTISSNRVGAGDIQVSGLDVLGIGRASDGTMNPNSVFEQGTLASVTFSVNNEDVTIDGSNTNNIRFAGVTVTLNHTFNIKPKEEDFANTGEYDAALAAYNADHIGVGITRNVDDAFNNIKSFIDSYNTIISRLESLVRDRKSQNERSYMPLTDEEKASMTDRQIEQWEEIAKKGLLKDDNGIRQLAQTLRTSFFQEISGLGVNPSSLGLMTGEYRDGTGGQIFIDEARLRSALEEDPDRVMRVFTQDAIGATFAQRGLVARIKSTIDSFMSASGTSSDTLKSLEDSMRRANEQIEKMQLKMFAEEDRLYRQFAAMETALSRMQSQGDWFSAMLGANK